VLRRRRSCRAPSEIARHRDLGRSVVAVVSAIGTTTDVLLEKAHRIARNPEPSALALMVATGEDVAAAFLTMALENAGLPVALMEPVGIGLRCDGEPLDAVPCGLDTELVLRAIAGGLVGVVPGFCGGGPDGKIYLLAAAARISRRSTCALPRRVLPAPEGRGRRVRRAIPVVTAGGLGAAATPSLLRRRCAAGEGRPGEARSASPVSTAADLRGGGPGAERATRIGAFPTRLADAAEPAAPVSPPDFTQQST
jgi:hypothetical protein